MIEFDLHFQRLALFCGGWTGRQEWEQGPRKEAVWTAQGEAMVVQNQSCRGAEKGPDSDYTLD